MQALPDPQWINCDIRNFDFSILGKFGVIMTDPPWEIHQDLPYGTMSDQELLNMGVAHLQDDGVIFMWVTGRCGSRQREGEAWRQGGKGERGKHRNQKPFRCPCQPGCVLLCVVISQPDCHNFK